MFRQLCAPVLLLTWLVGIFNPSLANYLVAPVICTDASINLRYSQPLPAASTQNTVTASGSDSGVWYSCNLGPVNISISYYVNFTVTDANCEKATFSNFIFTGFFNCSTLAQEPASTKNLTVLLSDPDNTRYLDETQPFLGPIEVPAGATVPGVFTVPTLTNVIVPGAGSLYVINFTLIFPQENHQPCDCRQVRSERVGIIPQLYLINLFNSSYAPIIPPTLARCK
ncbi:unnamed protein product [Adineta steineri]|uniref:Uncharacterized protein n=1 Tax=Adineta steineri TaxID=433720 RepID=A0A814YTU8_9BILA|nr:unnamed protein product [Adineta steineri]CAF1292748.1 unnamed protein product [Adineta steineri]CAF3870786.1 unnamed protein product [Adineta steineri]CAF3884618.1 unnamed protein product [Adineta steineri]